MVKYSHTSIVICTLRTTQMQLQPWWLHDHPATVCVVFCWCLVPWCCRPLLHWPGWGRSPVMLPATASDCLVWEDDTCTLQAQSLWHMCVCVTWICSFTSHTLHKCLIMLQVRNCHNYCLSNKLLDLLSTLWHHLLFFGSRCNEEHKYSNILQWWQLDGWTMTKSFQSLLYMCVYMHVYMCTCTLCLLVYASLKGPTYW